MAVLTFSFHSRDETPRSSRRASSLSWLLFFLFFFCHPFLVPPAPCLYPNEMRHSAAGSQQGADRSHVGGGGCGGDGCALRGQAALDEVFSWMLMECRMDLRVRERQRGSQEEKVKEVAAAHERERLISPRPEPWDGGRREVMDARGEGGGKEWGGEDRDMKACWSVWKCRAASPLISSCGLTTRMSWRKPMQNKPHSFDWRTAILVNLCKRKFYFFPFSEAAHICNTLFFNLLLEQFLCICVCSVMLWNTHRINVSVMETLRSKWNWIRIKMMLDFKLKERKCDSFP